MKFCSESIAFEVGSLNEQCGKYQFWSILDTLELACESLLNLDKTTTISSLYQGKKRKLDFWKILPTFDFILFVTRENHNSLVV